MTPPPRNLEIAFATAKDLDSLLSLHEKTFLPIDGQEQYEESKQSFTKTINNDRVLVARVNHNFVGFAAFDLMGENLKAKKSTQSALFWASSQVNYPALSQYAVRRFDEIKKGEIVVEMYTNNATSSHIKVRNHNLYFSELVVIDEYRRQGIGRALTLKRIEQAEILKSQAIYVSCYGGGFVSKIYERLGFIPIIKLGPFYNDGHAITEMVKFLE